MEADEGCHRITESSFQMLQYNSDYFPNKGTKNILYFKKFIGIVTAKSSTYFSKEYTLIQRNFIMVAEFERNVSNAPDNSFNY